MIPYWSTLAALNLVCVVSLAHTGPIWAAWVVGVIFAGSCLNLGRVMRDEIRKSGKP